MYAKDVIDKVDSMQEQMGNVCREMQIQRRNQKEVLDIKLYIYRNLQNWKTKRSQIEEIEQNSKNYRMSIE